MARSLAAALGALAALAAAPVLAAAPAPVGHTGTLRVEMDLTGKGIHRTQVMAFRMEAEEGLALNGLAAQPDENSPNEMAARSRRDANMERRMAGARASMDKLDMDAVARACDQDRDSAECKAGQRALQAAMGQVDQAMQDTYKENLGGLDPESKRFQRWHALQTPGGGCGTVEAKVLDPGKPVQVSRLPASQASAQIDTCFSSLVIDTETGEIFLHLTPVNVLTPSGQRGDFVIDGADVNRNGTGGEYDSLSNSLTIRNPKRQGQPGKLSGTVTYPSYRGATVVRWSFRQD